MAGKFPTGLLVGLIVGGFIGYSAGAGGNVARNVGESPAQPVAPSAVASTNASSENSSTNIAPTSTEEEEIRPVAAPVGPKKPEPPPSDWVIQNSVEEMTDKPVRHACTTSANKISLDFPYGERGARLCIRKHPTFGQDVYVTLDGSGQIICRSYDGCTIRIRFDDGEVLDFSANGPSDNSTEMVFVSNDTRFIAAAKKASRIRIQLEFFQNGVQTFDFPARGLSW